MEDGEVLEPIRRYQEKTATREMEERSKHTIGVVNIEEVQRQLFHTHKKVEKLLDEEVSRRRESERNVEEAKLELKRLKAAQKRMKDHLID